MSVASAIAGVVSQAIKPIADAYSKRIERRMAKDSLKAKALLSQQEGEQRRELTDAEWEIVVAGQMAGTWKDEFALIVGTLPYLAIFGGGMWYGLTGDYRALDGAMAGIQALAGVGVDVGFIITAVVLAASGLSVWRWMSR